MASCLNCGRQVSNVEEYCQQCFDKLDEMVDAQEMNMNTKVDFEGTSNPFYSTVQMTGIRSQSTQSVESMVDTDERGGMFFWRNLGLVTVVFIVLLVIVT